MERFNTKEEYQGWIEGQDWYQTIELKNGLKTPGKFPTHLRTPVFDTVDFEGKTVLDVGCNSGQHSFLAKERGATRTLGVDVNTKRLKQARVLAFNEDYDDLEFREGSIFELEQLGQFDIVLCIAVLTEIQDIFGAISELKKVISKYALVELDIAKPLFYLSASKRWLKGYKEIPRRKAVTEVRQIKNGDFVVSPSFEVLRAAFGPEFSLSRKSGGIRYDLVEVIRRQKA